MKEKKKLIRLGQFLCIPLITFLILLLCEIPAANAQTPQQIAKKALAATVLLVMEDANGELLGYGSGFFVQPNQIATNFHVIDGAARGTAKRVGQETEYTIEGVTALNENHDLAILQVSASGIQPLPLADSDTVEIGDTVYVAGNPKGFFEGTFSDGIISAVRGDSTSKRLQMTAPVSSGSSGGPVLNGRGEVIGVSFATFRDGQNLNFAMPSNYLNGLITCAQGIAKFNQGQHAAAMVDFDTAIRLNSDYPEAYIWRGIAKNELGQRTAAIVDFDTVIQLRIRKRLQNQETRRINLGQHAAAMAADLDTAIRLNSDNASIYMWRGIVRSELEQHVAAITDLDTAIRLEPDFAFAYNYRGNAKYNLGQYDAAIADYDKAIQLNPDYAIAYNNRGNAKYDLGQYDAAIADFDTAIRLNPDDAFAYYARGWAKHELRQYDAAITDYNTAIHLDPDAANIYYNRGNAKHKLGQYVAAIADFDTAIRLNPDDAFAYNNRGNAKYDLGQYDAAIADYDTAIRLNPDDAYAYKNRGLAKVDLGQHFAAIADCDMAIRFNPNLASAYTTRGLAKYRLGQYAAAIVDFDAAIRLNHDDGWAYYNRGLARHYLGRTWEATRDFQTSLALAKRTGDKRLETHAESTIRDLQ